MKQVFNLVRPREYEGRNGTQTTWDRVGILIQDGERISLRLDTMPIGNWDGWLRAFPREQEQPGQQRQAMNGQPHPATRPAAPADFDDELPF
jgi:hypothetical protein